MRHDTRPLSRNPVKPFRLVASAAVLAALLLASPTLAQSEDDEDAGAWAAAKTLYEKAKEKAQSMGESLPDKVPDWIKDDLKNAGTWQYKVEEVALDDLQERLDELGAERWECFSVNERGKKARLVLKRRKRSQLREIQDLSADDLLIVLKVLKNRGKAEE
ncbi:MAG: hypothetical protein AAF657_11485 [Acidobacteriota bacterium]